MSQPSASPSLIVHSTARSFGTGSEPGCARQTGHVRVFSGAPYASSQRQNIFVRVFRWTWISRPTTGSQLGMRQLLRLDERLFDRASDFDHRQSLLERERVHPDQPELALARLERELEVADQHGPRAVEDARLGAEDPARRDDELGRPVLDPPHAAAPARRVGTGSKARARSSAWPARKSVFSENCGPISWRPTGSPSESPHGIERPGRPAMFGGIVSTSERYMASGFSVRAPSGNATVGEVGETRTSKRSKAAANSRPMRVRTFCAWP